MNRAVGNREPGVGDRAARLRRARCAFHRALANSRGLAGRRGAPGAVRRSGDCRIATAAFRIAGFSLIEVLVALAVFATMAALAYGGLDSVVRTRAELGRQQLAFSAMLRSVSSLERDLRQAVVRPVRGSYGETLPAFVGASDRIELTRVGFANPQAELRSNLERVFYAQVDATLVRGAYPVLDRAPATKPKIATLRAGVRAFRLRYLNAENGWSDSWPPPGAAADATLPALPRAVEFRLDSDDYGEISRIIELASPWPDSAVEALAP